MKDFWARVGGPDSVNWTSFAVTFPILLVTALIGSGVDSRHGLLPLILAATLGAIAMFAALLVAKFTILRPAAERPMPLVTVLVFLVALAIRAATFDELLILFALEDQSRFWFRFFASTSTTGVTLVLMAYMMSLAREFSRNSRLLRETNETLRATKRDIDKKIRAKREDVVGSVRAELEERLKALTGTSAKQALKKLRSTIEEVVRPVSYELARQVTDLSAPETEPVSGRVLWSRVFADSTSLQPFKPFAFSFWAGFATLCFAPLQWGFEIGLILALVVSLVPFALLSAFANLWSRVMPIRSTIVRSVVFTVALFVTAQLSGFAITKVSEMEELGYRSLLPLGLLWIILGWGIALIPSLRSETTRVLNEQQQASRKLKDELVRLNTAYRLQQQAIARALHGPIQDALSVAAFKLSDAIKDNSATPELIAELNEMISSTVVLLDLADSEAPVIEKSLSELAEFWDGVARIRWKLTPAAKKTLAKQPVTSATAVELIREACSNAVRHGRAKQIGVLVSLSKDSKRLEITVENDGALVKLQSNPGLGTKLLNELTLSWKLSSAEGKTTLLAETPVI
ncbi:MAG: hypothetical protein RLZZ108_358 [Actinomycetota bacterium]